MAILKFPCFWTAFSDAARFFRREHGKIPTGGKKTPPAEVKCGCALLAPAVFVEYSAHRGCGFVYLGLGRMQSEISRARRPMAARPTPTKIVETRSSFLVPRRHRKKSPQIGAIQKAPKGRKSKRRGAGKSKGGGNSRPVRRLELTARCRRSQPRPSSL